MSENNKFYRGTTWDLINKRFDSLEERLKTIEENHLPHLNEEISSLKQRLAYYAGGIVVAGAIIQWLLK